MKSAAAIRHDIDLLIFDLDGTLIDSRADIAAATNFILRERDLPEQSLDVICGWIGDGSRELVARALGMEVDEPAVAAATRQFRDHYEEHPCARTTLYPGVREFLDRHLGCLAMAIVTNKPLPITLRVLEHLGLERHFDPILGERSVPRLKPHPDPVRFVLEMHDVAPRRAMMVGDGPQDLLAARAAGVVDVAALYGFHAPDRLRSLSPTIAVERLDELSLSLSPG